MKDLYKRLGVDAACTEAELKAALARADGETCEAARYILLDPDRRAVYDRNRRVLSIIGQVRGNLGLNLTSFWPATRFGDFTVDLTPPRPGRLRPPRPRQPRPSKALNSRTVLWAFGKEPLDERRAARQRRLRTAMTVATWSAGLGVAVLLAWLEWHRV